MKQSLKINKVNLLLFICLLLAAILFLLAMDNDRAHRTYLYRDCGIDKRDVRILAETDTHGGFHGDGTYFLAADCSAKSGKIRKIVQNWQKLPLPEPLDDAYDVFCDGYFSEFPVITDGYYLFYDRLGQTSSPESLYDRASYNFNLAVYDSETDQLYYIRVDT